jgi:hypothetical protein
MVPSVCLITTYFVYLKLANKLLRWGFVGFTVLILLVASFASISLINEIGDPELDFFSLYFFMYWGLTIPFSVVFLQITSL